MPQWRLRYIERKFSWFCSFLAYFCAQFVNCALQTVRCNWYSAWRFLLSFASWIDWKCDSYFASQKMNLGLFSPPSLSKTGTYLECLRWWSSCVLQVEPLAIGVCCFAVLGNVKSGISSCMKTKFVIWGKTVSSSLQYPCWESVDWTTELRSCLAGGEEEFVWAFPKGDMLW